MRITPDIRTRGDELRSKLPPNKRDEKHYEVGWPHYNKDFCTTPQFLFSQSQFSKDEFSRLQRLDKAIRQWKYETSGISLFLRPSEKNKRGYIAYLSISNHKLNGPTGIAERIYYIDLDRKVIIPKDVGRQIGYGFIHGRTRRPVGIEEEITASPSRILPIRFCTVPLNDPMFREIEEKAAKVIQGWQEQGLYETK